MQCGPILSPTAHTVPYLLVEQVPVAVFDEFEALVLEGTASGLGPVWSVVFRGRARVQQRSLPLRGLSAF
eukprot:jgi/Tetstr1/425521/TSEL_001532.t1